MTGAPLEGMSISVAVATGGAAASGPEVGIAGWSQNEERATGATVGGKKQGVFAPSKKFMPPSMLGATIGAGPGNGSIPGAIAGAHIDVQFTGRAPGGKSIAAAMGGPGMAQFTCRWPKAALLAPKLGATPELPIAAAAAAAAAAGGAATATAVAAAEALAVEAAPEETAAPEIRDILGISPVSSLARISPPEAVVPLGGSHSVLWKASGHRIAGKEGHRAAADSKMRAGFAAGKMLEPPN